MSEKNLPSPPIYDFTMGDFLNITISKKMKDLDNRSILIRNTINNFNKVMESLTIKIKQYYKYKVDPEYIEFLFKNDEFLGDIGDVIISYDCNEDICEIEIKKIIDDVLSNI